MTLATYEPVYDETPDAYSNDAVEINPELSEQEVEKAIRLWRFSRGIMLVTGMPGSGKDLFLTVFSWLMKRYFNRTVFLDFYPRKPFGFYYYFNEHILKEEFQTMTNLAEAGGKHTQKQMKEAIQKDATDWVKKNEARLKGAVLGLAEFWRYVHNRNPFSPIGIAMSSLVKVWRHLDLLLIGNTQQEREIDAISILPYVTHTVRCQWASTLPGTGLYYLKPAKFMTTTGVLEITGKAVPLKIDGLLERPELNGLRYVDLFNSKGYVGLVSKKVNL